MNNIDEYLRRNLIHAKSVGIGAGLKSSISRLENNKNSPKWLINTLKGLHERSLPVASECAKHRDEVKA
jgi:hypothetical protein